MEGFVFAFVVYFVLYVICLHYTFKKKSGNQITLDQGLFESCEDQSFWQMQTEAQSWARWMVMFFPSSIQSCVNHRLFWCLKAPLPVQRWQRSRGVQPVTSLHMNVSPFVLLSKDAHANTWLGVGPLCISNKVQQICFSDQALSGTVGGPRRLGDNNG